MYHKLDPYGRQVKTTRSKKHSSTRSKKHSSKTKEKQTDSFQPSSVTLKIEHSEKLLESDNYQIKFHVGKIEGKAFSVSEDGKTITFLESGTYRAEYVGLVSSSNEEGAIVVFHSPEFTTKDKIFSQIPIILNRRDNVIVASLTLNKGQTLTVRIIPDSKENILTIGSDTLLIIHKIA